jgi:hypothetical protein
MLNRLRQGIRISLVAALVSSSVPSVRAAVIPPDMDQTSVSSPVQPDLILQKAGLSPREAGARVKNMDRAEMAQLQSTDLTQRGGDPTIVAALAIIGAVALIIFIARNI